MHSGLGALLQSATICVNPVVFSGCIEMPFEHYMNIRSIAEQAKQASIAMRSLGLEQKNTALAAIQEELLKRSGDIVSANKKDMERSSGLPSALKKRLKFQQDKLNEVLAGLAALQDLPDPVGQVLEARELASGLNLYRIRCPIGLIAMIFESRPDAAVQISSLALKSGNSILLKGEARLMRP